MRKIVIIGGVAGGATAATRLRRLSENTKITIFEAGSYVSFANCGLPYHISGLIADRSKLLLQSPESFKRRYNVDVKVNTKVLKIFPETKEVLVKNLFTNVETKESYDQLLLSPGTNTFLPPIKGIQTANYHFLRSIEDMDRIMKQISQLSNKSALVIGGGFIGMEIVENLVEAGIHSHLVELNDQVMKNLDFDLAVRIHKELRDKKVNLHLKTSVKEIQAIPGGNRITLSNNQVLEVGIILLGTGVLPRTELALDAQLDIGKTGGIIVNPYLQTSDPNIFAVGDAIEVKHLINRKQVLVPLAWPANRQGRIVADNIMGINPKPFKGVLGTSIAKIFDLTVASTGLNEKQLENANIKYHVATINRLDHAGYYPGASDIILKLLFDEEGAILGAQGIGENGVDKRIDVIATAIRGKLKAQELQELELAYAPPYNSAKDPVNILGYLAENILTKMVETVEYNQLEALSKDNRYNILDVRTKKEYDNGALFNAQNIDINTLRDNLHLLDRDKIHIVYCRVGFRSYLAYRILINNGFKARNLTGGYTLYEPMIKPSHYERYIGIIENLDSFSIAISDGHQIISSKTYMLSDTAIPQFLTDLERQNVPLSQILICMEERNHQQNGLLYQLCKQKANVWITRHSNQPKAASNGLNNAKAKAISLANFAYKQEKQAVLLKFNDAVCDELYGLEDKRKKLNDAMEILTFGQNGQKYYFDSVAMIKRDLEAVDSKIDFIWSMAMKEQNALVTK
jgi:NADPH-dependent 2,4-dienoyl-CoA reductase/sulfur reductase-like enzyme/rhodanese-related sulfurtransferase